MKPIDDFSLRCLTTAIAIVCLAGFVGCGGSSGPARYEVSGTVNYAGKPVPSGEVIIEPDSSKNNQGPQARAFIENVRFATRPNYGAVAGPAIVRVNALNGVAHAEAPQGSAIGLPYEVKLDLPAADSTHALVIPTE